MRTNLFLKMLSLISVIGTVFADIAASKGCVFILYEPEAPEDNN